MHHAWVLYSTDVVKHRAMHVADDASRSERHCARNKSCHGVLSANGAFGILFSSEGKEQRSAPALGWRRRWFRPWPCLGLGVTITSQLQQFVRVHVVVVLAASQPLSFFTTVNVTQSYPFYHKVLKTINCTRRSETTRETFLTRVVRDSLAIWCDRQMMCDCKTAPAGAQAASHRRHAQRCKLLCARAKTMRVHAQSYTCMCEAGQSQIRVPSKKKKIRSDVTD